MRYPKDSHRKFEHCIFCKERAGSKEHILPKWIHRKLRPSANAKAPYIFVHADGAEELVIPEASSPITTFTSKAVCKDCNTGWMAEIVSSAKPTIEMLIDGNEKRPLSKEERLAIIKQFGVIAAVMDVENTSVGPALSQLDRETLMKKGKLPRFRLWIGKYFEFCGNPESTTGFVRAVENVGLAETIPQFVLFKRHSLALGRLVAVTELGDPNGLTLDKRPVGLRRVQHSSALNWPPGQTITWKRFRSLSLKDPISGDYRILHPYGRDTSKDRK